jgi:uncharacterized membrane protein
MQELVVIGFTEKSRAIEVLPQLQQLKFHWCADLQDAVAVEVETDGHLRMLHGQLSDPASNSNAQRWKAILSAIVPPPHVPQSSTVEVLAEVCTINSYGNRWLKTGSLDSDFIRDAAALLQPGNSAILAVIRKSFPAIAVLMDYSYVVLYTNIDLSSLDSSAGVRAE